MWSVAIFSTASERVGTIVYEKTTKSGKNSLNLSSLKKFSLKAAIFLFWRIPSATTQEISNSNKSINNLHNSYDDGHIEIN